ncbi:MAG: efflux RND transporter permease subunit, partial [Myxococcota bacterium]|nr:efflux RND transporter permease subunit [Myxococcota bacterium]
AVAGIVWHKIGAAGKMGAWGERWLGLFSDSITGINWTTALGLGLIAMAMMAWAWYIRRHGLRSSYAELLGWTLDHRWVALVATVGLTATGYYAYQQIEHRGTPWQSERRVDMSVTIDRSYSLEKVKEHFSEIERRLMERKSELDIESLTTRFSQRRGSIRAYLVNADDGQLTTQEAGTAIKALLPEKVGYTYKMGRSRSWQGNMLGVEVQLQGRNPDVLAVLVEEVAAGLQKLPGVEDVDSSLEDGEEEVRVEVDRAQALNYGLSPQEVASGIASALGTRRTSGFKSEDREIDIVMQLNEGDRSTLDQLRNSTFDGRDGTSIQLGSLADFHIRRGPRDLRRADRQLNVTVFANTKNRKQAQDLATPIREMMSQMALPPGYSWDLGRAARWGQEDADDSNFT